MSNSALKHKHTEQSISDVSTVDVAFSDEIVENVVQMKTRQQMIAKQSEDACNMAGNICGPELDYFEEKYGICGFV